ncbi:hypothetical protein GCM10020001_002790 [Nonomuraea salmonea]
MGRGEASRRRLLDAAAAEFAAYGIAGARVDRIAAEAKVSKAVMYAKYGSKEDLFDAVLADQVQGVLDVAPLTPPTTCPATPSGSTTPTSTGRSSSAWPPGPGSNAPPHRLPVLRGR